MVPTVPVIAICSSAPGTTIARTAIRSRSEKCSPTPNISSTTPISDACAATPPSEASERRCEADRDAREEIADDRRETQARGDDAEQQRDGEGERDRRDESRPVLHLWRRLVLGREERLQANASTTAPPAKHSPRAATMVPIVLICRSIRDFHGTFCCMIA